MAESPKLWSFDRKTEIASVDCGTTNPAYRSLCYAVIDAVLEIRKTGLTKPEHVRTFANAIECRFEYVFSHGGRRLVQCSHFDKTAGEELIALMDHPKWRIRFNTVAIMDYRPPENVLIEVLKKGIKDNVRKVRALAVSKSLALNLPQLIGSIISNVGVESDGEIREEMKRVINWLQGKPAMVDGELQWLVRSADGRRLSWADTDPGNAIK